MIWKQVQIKNHLRIAFYFPLSFVNILTLQPICIQQNVYSNIDLYRRINEMQHMVDSRVENILCINSIQPQYNNNENFGSFRAIEFFFSLNQYVIFCAEKRKKARKII